jgi:CubicO group peptidase (beta-lactamase class C family)
MEGLVHPDFAPVTEKVHTLMSKRSALGGMAVAVYHRGELVVDAWTGVRDASGTPWDRDTMSMSFSTTKGVVATIVHRLVDQGLLDYDVPVARYWPEFAAGGKDAITLRHLLTHQAALHDVRALAESTETLLDWDEMTRLLAAAGPAWEVGTRSGYHALTYGWLVGELIRRVTGLTVNQALQREIVEPLGLDGQMYIGAPPDVRNRISTLLVDPKASVRLLHLLRRLSRFDRYAPLYSALVVDDILDVGQTERIHDAEIPAANGVFTARSLARMYAALATPDAFDGPAAAHGGDAPRGDPRTAGARRIGYWSGFRPVEGRSRRRRDDQHALAPRIPPGRNHLGGAAEGVRPLRLRRLGCLGRSGVGAGGCDDPQPGRRHTLRRHEDAPHRRRCGASSQTPRHRLKRLACEPVRCWRVASPERWAPGDHGSGRRRRRGRTATPRSPAP